jgi:PAS domain S-box-containing protein
MLNDFLQTRAALYASGAMTSQEREQFELVLEFHHELREFVTGLCEVGAVMALTDQRPGGSTPSTKLKARIMSLVANRPQRISPDGIVVSGPNRLVEWINPAFSEMCGYSLEELRGKNPGPILQGPKTDSESVARIRRALREQVPCKETLLNYHKNGTPYLVEISITPILDDANQPLWFVAREREMTNQIAA